LAYADRSAPGHTQLDCRQLFEANRQSEVKLTQRMAAGLVALMLGATIALGQDAPSSTADQPNPPFRREQLDQMLAPIALYPDPLLAQILMAATYPLEVVEADRWIQDPAHAKLDKDQLAVVLEQEPWDPSVKSLVPFPQILKMMDLNLEWTEALGEAFLADEAGVMDSIQRLREDAKTAGRLSSTVQQSVSVESEGGPITIEPTSSETMYVPDYNPAVAYGAWPYPDYPPMVFPGFFGGDAIVFVIAPLRHFAHWDWIHHRIEIDRDRFAILNHNHQPIGGVVWEHDPLHRLGVPYRMPAVQGRDAASNAASGVRVIRGPPSVGIPEAPTVPRAGGQPQLVRPAPMAHVPPTFAFPNHGADASMSRQFRVARPPPVGRAPVTGGVVRVSPYSPQR
jgi:hypothetical protein